MKIKSLLFSIIVLSCFVLTTNINAQSTFEGYVNFKMTEIMGGSGPITMKIFTKGNKTRMEMKATGAMAAMGSGAIILDGDDAIVLMPQQKMYMKLPKNNDMANEGPDEEVSMDDFKSMLTGNTEVILGHLCKEIVIKGDDATSTEVWYAEDMGNFFKMSSPGQQTPEWQKKLMGENVFPLKVVTKDKTGKIISSMIATEVKEQSVSDDLFKAPANYKPMNMGGF